MYTTKFNTRTVVNFIYSLLFCIRATVSSLQWIAMDGQKYQYFVSWVKVPASCFLIIPSFHMMLCSRDRPVILFFYLLCYAAVLIKFAYYVQYYAQKKNYAQSIITFYIQIYMNKSLHRETYQKDCFIVYKLQQNNTV